MSPKVTSDDYQNAWSRIMQRVREGDSWSGRERNRCLLNVEGLGFVDASSIVNLDGIGDGRAMAVLDWDQDGDLDI